jgi:hypothetical protein
VAQRVGEQIEQHALDLLGREARGDAVVDARAKLDLAGARLCLDPP